MVIHIVISSKKKAKFALVAENSFDPDSDSNESGFRDLLTISITLLYHGIAYRSLALEWRSVGKYGTTQHRTARYNVAERNVANVT